jgi:hypothetical protein
MWFIQFLALKPDACVQNLNLLRLSEAFASFAFKKLGKLKDPISLQILSSALDLIETQ